jgi:Protein of unknown function (DUF3489)
MRCSCGRAADHRSGYPKLSNNIIQKGLAFGRDWSGTVVNSGRQRRSEIFAPPARWPRWGFGGAARRRDRPNGGSRMSKSAKKRSAASSAGPVLAAEPSQEVAHVSGRRKADGGSKQSRVIAMLQSPTGATVAAMMKATGWQQHSVRGLLAGVVRKRLKLKLNSKKVDGSRVYQIASGNKATSRQSKRRSS